MIARPSQPSLFDLSPKRPEGLGYRPGFLSQAEEKELVPQIAALPFREFEFHGFLGRRRTVSFGWRYVFDGSGLRPAEPIPGFLTDLRGRAAAFAGLDPAALVHALVTKYAPGAGIGWHKDRSVFDRVVGISLLAPARLRFRRRNGERWERFTLEAEPRSAYLLGGIVRAQWEHSIHAVEDLRYSITFRSLREGSST